VPGSGDTSGSGGLSHDGSGGATAGSEGADETPGGGSGSASGGGETGGAGTGGSGSTPSYPVPGNAYCAEVADWPSADAGQESTLLALINERRAAGADCGAKGVFGPAPALALAPSARCAIRVHLADMAARWYVSHATWTPDGALCTTREECGAGQLCEARGVAGDTTKRCGDGPRNRLAKAGVSPVYVGENLYRGKSLASDAVSWWMSSPGHCANIMNPNFTRLGGAYLPDDPELPHLWGVVFTSALD
jgi:uncharacterized protein YkwD